MGKKSSKIAVIAALTSVIPTLAAPQQQGGAGVAATQAAPGGLQIDFGINTGLTFDDNFKLSVGGGAGQSTIWDTNLNMNISKVTAVDTLLLRTSGVVRFADIPGRTITGFESPDARLSYSRDGINSRLALDARYRKADREFLDPFKVEQEEQQSGNLIGGGGTLTQQNYGIAWTTGLQAPVSFSLNLRHDEKDYANVTNPRVFDTRTDSVKATVGFQVSQLTQLSLNAGHIHYRAEDSVRTDRNTNDVSVGLQQDINPVLVLNANIGWTEIKTDEALPVPTSRTRGGVSGLATLTQTLANGTAWGSLGSTVSTSGQRLTFRLGRDYTLPLGTLSVSAGATRGPNDKVKAVGSIAYTRQLLSSDFSLQLDRSASTNSASEDVLNTRLSAAYGYQINNLSRVDLSLNYGVSDNTTTGVKIERATLRGAYSRQLTADWTMTGGVQYRTYDETAVGNADSKQLFLTLGRTFSYRP